MKREGRFESQQSQAQDDYNGIQARHSGGATTGALTAVRKEMFSGKQRILMHLPRYLSSCPDAFHSLVNYFWQPVSVCEEQ